MQPSDAKLITHAEIFKTKLLYVHLMLGVELRVVRPDMTTTRARFTAIPMYKLDWPDDRQTAVNQIKKFAHFLRIQLLPLPKTSGTVRWRVALHSYTL